MRVDFYTGPEFLRSKQRTNPFIDPIIAVCKANRIEYRVFVPSMKIKCGYDEAHVKSYRFIVFVHTWAWRISRLLCRVSGLCVRRFAGSLVKFLWKDSFSSDVAVIMAGGAECFLYWSLNVKRIVDLQHGVIYSRHRGYFDPNGRFLGAVNKSEVSNLEFWLFGQGYAECFFKNPENAKDLQGRVKVIGDVIKHQRVERDVKNIIVVSGQFKPECSRQCLLDQVESLRKFLREVDCIFAGRGCKVLIKHHPRFKGIDALDLLYKEFPFFEETKESWEKLYVVMKIHATFSSTVVFDSASNGIVSYLIPPPNEDPVLENWFWRDDYHYPFFGKNLKEVVSLSETVGTEAVVRDWYLKYYEPFSEKKCLQLLTEQRRVS